MPVTEVVDGIINLIRKNLIAITNLASDALTGEIIIKVDNSFHYNAGEEIILIDFGYNDVNSPHNQIFEYARIKEVNNTSSITLEQPIQDPDGGWLVSENAFIQKNNWAFSSLR